MVRSRILVFAWLACGLGAQGETFRPEDTARDFAALKDEVQSALVRQVTRKVQLDANPVIQRIVSMQRAHGALPPGAAPPYHRAAKWAKGVAPKRKVIRAGQAKYAAMRQRYPARTLLPDLHKAVWYDWGRGMIVRRDAPLTTREQMENLLAGYPPGSDDTLAQILAKLDSDPKMRPLAHYFGHSWASLDAEVFEGITIYEAWYSGEQVDVPDVDAIPFEQRVLGTRKFRSPIPAGKRREWLYQQVRDAALRFRKYRTLREAAAAAYFRASPKLDPVYESLVPRFHFLYVTYGEDLGAVSRLMSESKDRRAFFDAVGALIEKRPTDWDRRLARRKNLEDMQNWLTYWMRLAVWEQKQRDKSG